MSDVDTEDGEPDADDPYAAENARLHKLLESHASILAEHFDSVRIIATHKRGDGCYGRLGRGEGNYFSQYGAIKDWLIEQDQQTRNQSGE